MSAVRRSRAATSSAGLKRVFVTALLDEIRHLDDSGQVNFRGASFRTYVLENDRWYVVWMMANVEGFSALRAEVVDGEVHTTGEGRDPGGDLVEWKPNGTTSRL